MATLIKLYTLSLSLSLSLSHTHNFYVSKCRGLPTIAVEDWINLHTLTWREGSKLYLILVIVNTCNNKQQSHLKETSSSVSIGPLLLPLPLLPLPLLPPSLSPPPPPVRVLIFI